MKRFGILLDIQPVEYLENSVLSSRLARDNDKLISYSAKTCQQTKLSNAGRQPRPGPGWVQDSLSLKEFLLSAVKHSWLCLETAGPRLQTQRGINRGSGAGPGGGRSENSGWFSISCELWAVSVMTREQPHQQLCQRFFVSHQAVEFGQGRVSNGGHIRVYKSVPF